MLYSKTDFNREQPVPSPEGAISHRPEFWRDYARLIHSPAFRRLQGKTQLFAGIESDFFRNRLTHSIEVAQIAKSIAFRINGTAVAGKKRNDQIDLDLVSFAAMAHDLGHPPFGHNGELALDHCMKDAGGFEGNAQTLRILAKLEKKGDAVKPFSGASSTDSRVGLNLTHRALAAVLKYDNEIPISNEARHKSNSICKGFYASEATLVKRVKSSVIGKSKCSGDFKTIECQIMDLADDIAYSTYDLEDALKAGFVSPIEIVSDTMDSDFMKRIAEKIQPKLNDNFSATNAVNAVLKLFLTDGLIDFEHLKTVIDKTDLTDKTDSTANVVAAHAIAAVKAFAVSKSVSQNGYIRNKLTSSLVDRFVKGVECKWNPKAPAFSQVYFSDEIFRQVETLKHYTYEKFILSPRLKVAEFRGYEIVSELFKTLDNKGASLLPEDFKSCYDSAPTNVEKKRVICDFIAGMTDRYAIEFHGRLHSETPQTIFKPL